MGSNVTVTGGYHNTYKKTVFAHCISNKSAHQNNIIDLICSTITESYSLLDDDTSLKKIWKKAKTR